MKCSSKLKLYYFASCNFNLKIKCHVIMTYKYFDFFQFRYPTITSYQSMTTYSLEASTKSDMTLHISIKENTISISKHIINF